MFTSEETTSLQQTLNTLVLMCLPKSFAKRPLAERRRVSFFPFLSFPFLSLLAFFLSFSLIGLCGRATGPSGCYGSPVLQATWQPRTRGAHAAACLQASIEPQAVKADSQAFQPIY